MKDADLQRLLAFMGPPPARYISIESRTWTAWVSQLAAAACAVAVLDYGHEVHSVPCSEHLRFAEGLGEEGEGTDSL